MFPFSYHFPYFIALNMGRTTVSLQPWGREKNKGPHVGLSTSVAHDDNAVLQFHNLNATLTIDKKDFYHLLKNGKNQFMYLEIEVHILILTDCPFSYILVLKNKTKQKPDIHYFLFIGNNAHSANVSI